jgi:hypothetical protein
MLQKCTKCSPLRTNLLELGHKQPVTPIRTDTSTAYGIRNETITQKRSKSMDMKYYSLHDRVRQNQFEVYWRPGKDNLGDYHTKHHPAQHHQYMRQFILHQANILHVLRGCAKLPQPKLSHKTDAPTFQFAKLPQPNLRQPTDVQISQHTLMATQFRCALVCAYVELLQSRPLWRLL